LPKNFPVFFCRDPIQGPDVIRSQARNPKNFLLDYDATFDLLGNTPEGNHAGLMFFSDHGTPDGWINEHGYGCHTFKWVNKVCKTFHHTNNPSEPAHTVSLASLRFRCLYPRVAV